MIWYLINILILTIAWLLPAHTSQEALLGEAKKSLEEQRRKKRLCIVGTVCWILLSGLRALSVGPDTLAYKIHRFDSTIKTPWRNIIYDFYNKYVNGAEIKDPGYTILEKAFQIFSTDYQVFLIFIAVVFFVPMGIFIYKYSRNPYVSFILFSCLFYSFFAITGHRQTIATAFAVFIGIELIKRRKLIWFLLLVIVFSTIHASALCFIPFYWISKIKINKITLGIYWIAIVAAFLFRYQLLAFLQSLIGYEGYQDYEGAGAGTFMLMLFLVAAVVTIFHKLLLKSNQPMVRMSINALLCACFFSPLLLINPSTMRVVQYYSLFLLILLPEIAVIFKGQKDRVVYNIVCCFLLIALLVLNQPQYSFFWQ